MNFSAQGRALTLLKGWVLLLKGAPGWAI